ncbi:Uma2 family endonuclease [Leptolyngbya boryana CZ1]|uniref:Uma2 family endonuclease n=1 Tax=Leptolyngbya boryana CZ1 TaxID=3060204 RepID=A0AA96WS25_LEPBY|nr:Uma2 family endonuclease [Leptolyngbya boryana]WNZ44552.1 Uma2 family endonuclease [Leptolyngbya boryana CZ1]
MTQAKPRFRTIEEYLDYDDGTDIRYELVDGELVEMPPESRLNRQIASFLFEVFLRLGLPSKLLAIGTQITVTNRKVTARQPDFVVLSQDCADALDGANRDVITSEIPSPTLVVEIVSPGNPGSENYDRDYIEKRKEYALREIAEYWIIDPNRNTVTVLALNGNEYQEIGCFQDNNFIVSPVFPALQIIAKQILQAGM